MATRVDLRAAETYWLIDPIDATGHFVRGIPFCTTMVALVHEGQPVVAVINDFVRDRLHSAAENCGATLNGDTIHVSQRPIHAAYVAVEIDISVGANLELLRQLRQRVVTMNSVSAGWDFGMVAEGRLDGRIRKDGRGKDYDYAPGVLLVREAGGVVENLGSRTYSLGDLNSLATNTRVNHELTTGSDALFPVAGE